MQAAAWYTRLVPNLEMELRTGQTVAVTDGFDLVLEVKASRCDVVPDVSELVEGTMRAGKLTTAHGPRGPVAIVANGPLLEKADRVYASLGTLAGLNVRVFTTLVGAEQWLQTQ